MVKKSSTTVTNQIKWKVRHPITTGEVYEIDSAGVVYKSTDSGLTWAVLAGTSSTNAHGNGLWIWKNYLFVARDTLLDVCGDGTVTGIANGNWTLGWKTIDSDVLWHPMLTSKNDDKIYGGAGRFIYTIEEETTFAPGTAATYTFTQQALDLPFAYRIKCLEELGNLLMAGTWQGTTINEIRKADIFPWDGSAISFGQPISIDEFGVHAMLNTGNSLTVLAGIEGNAFRCDGVSAYPIAQLPQDLSGGKYIEFYPSSIVNFKRKVFFGIGWVAGATAVSGMGVYSIKNTSKGSILNLEHLPSTLNDGTTNCMQITTLLPITKDTLLISWRDNTTYGIDLSSATSFVYTTTYSGYFDSPLYDTGVNENKWKPKKIEFHLGRPLRTDEGIRFSYRTNLTDSFTALKTLIYSDNGVGAITSRTFTTETPFDIKEGDQIQFRVALLGTSSGSPEFKFMIVE